MIEAVHPDPGIPNRWIFQRQYDAPEFMPVLGAGGENEAGMIEGVDAVRDKLRVQGINHHTRDIVG